MRCAKGPKEGVDPGLPGGLVCRASPSKITFSNCCLTLFFRVAEVLEGKGAGKRGRFQGKATKMSRRAEAQALLQDYVSAQSAEE